ncbi:MAG: patatin family protein [Clostridiales Family XIII bacterium]|jgi:predicted patatin/cPLA2 family phospholipase|nr:patatin family protein [Clostridiales Family XIII bacterium]
MIRDTALIFEGGGMRASYTAGALVTLLEEGIEFSDIYGISAGSSHTVNYISKDIWRSKASFVDFMATPGAAGARCFLRGRGYFSAEYIYERSCLPGGPLPYDFETFLNNPAMPHVESFERDTGRTVCWGKDDMPTLLDLMKRVRASSTMPFFMPPVEIDGHVYFDGGLGDSWGVPLAQAKLDGYKKFFIVRTQMRGYRKSKNKHPFLTKALFGARGIVAQRMIERYKNYNTILDEIDGLEAHGDAYVFYPRAMPVKNTTIGLPLLQASYDAGYEQARAELSAWRDFL